MAFGKCVDIRQNQRPTSVYLGILLVLKPVQEGARLVVSFLQWRNVCLKRFVWPLSRVNGCRHFWQEPARCARSPTVRPRGMASSTASSPSTLRHHGIRGGGTSFTGAPGPVFSTTTRSGWLRSQARLARECSSVPTRSSQTRRQVQSRPRAGCATQTASSGDGWPELRAWTV